MNSNLKLIINRNNRLKAIQLIQSRNKSEWHLLSAVCLQRVPQITPEMNWLEKKMSDILAKVEVNNSLYSDHEMRHFEDIRRAQRIASEVEANEKDLDTAAKETAQDFEERISEQLKRFVKAPRITQSDLINDRKSLTRCLDRHLMLVCKQKLGDKYHWLLPQTLHKSEETMRQTAERALFDFGGNQLKVNYLGNAPTAVYRYRYPLAITKETDIKGSKIFFFKAYHTSGDFIQNKEFCSDYEWLNRKELSLVMPENYWNAINKSLLVEDLNLNEIIDRNKTFKRLLLQFNKNSNLSINKV